MRCQKLGAVVGALREAGHEVIAANNTAGALRLIQTEIPPDLAILDLAMPEGTGELLLRLIRNRFVFGEQPDLDESFAMELRR